MQENWIGSGRVGRKKLFRERALLALVQGTFAAIDSVRREGETRVDFIRAAIGNEIARRLSPSQKPKPKKD
jgi:hypothetical protein